MNVVHVAPVGLTKSVGMGRNAIEWKQAFEKRGINFIHIGWKELGNTTHPLLFGWKVRRYLINKKIKIDLLLVHEPAGGFLHFSSVPLIVFSHGIEEKAWLQKIRYGYELLGWKSKLLPVFVRFFSNNYGFKKANKILLSNISDKDYLINTKGIDVSKIIVFTNGFYDFKINKIASNDIICLFNSSWIERKGIKLLVEAFNYLLPKYDSLKLRLAGSNISPDILYSKFNIKLKNQIEIISHFSADEEVNLYKGVSIFVLPSYFEGQSLALTQAMAMGLCPVAANNSGQTDFIKNDVNGLLFETGNINQLIEQLEKLINNKNLISSLGNNAKLSVQDFKWDIVSEKLVEQIISSV